MSKILLIDDDRIVTELVALSLTKKLGAVCEAAHSFQEGKVLLGENPQDYDLAIVDCNLPDAAEGEMIDYALSCGVPTLVLAATYDDALRKRLLEKRIVDYVVKRDIKELNHIESAVRRLLQNRQTKALVVDDSAACRESMAQLLRNQLLMVFEASNGQDALRVLDQNPDILLVITDHAMPKMDGLELLTQIRKHYRKDSLAVIIASDTSGASVIPRFLKAGANDYLLKPYGTEEFICRINATLENIRMIQALKDQSSIDPLTGLCNRRFLFEAGGAFYAVARRSGLSLCVIMLDLDHFRHINDAYGHEAGDQMLKLVADIIRRYFRRKTDIVARIGGEEFCVVQSCESTGNLHSFVDGLRAAIAEAKLSYSHYELSITVSIGVAAGSFGSFEEMVKAADSLLSQAKTRGRNQVVFAS
ncbi:MAG: response regulator receiver [Nitrospirae bacterium]|nr:MAG: response regulator receiver [Nitrospirota bacterium]